MWSVDDSAYEGARLRSNLLCRRGAEYSWGKDMEMPGFSSFITRSPQLALLDDGVSFVIVKGDSAPYHLRSNGADRYRWDPNLQEYAEYEYYIADEASRRIMSSFVLHTPVLTDSILAQFDVQVIGPPLEGYDGSPGGAGIRDITRTYPFIFRSSDVVNWELNYRQSPVFTTRDTVRIRGVIIDSATAQEIGSSGEYLVLPVCNDTTIALGFELPPSYYPEAKTYLCIDVYGGAIEEPSRRLSSIINILSDESAGKRRAASAIRDGSPAPLSIQIYPQPSNNQITINIRGLRGNDFTLELFDALGRRVHDHNFCHSASGAGHVQLDTRYFRSGVYYFSIKSSAAIRYGKFIVSW